MPRYVFKHASLYLITHLPVTARGYDSILTCSTIDRLSKLVYFIPCKEAITAKEMAQLFLSVVVVLNGMPRKLISNCDLRFLSQFWQALFGAFGVEHNASTIHHP